jgi:Protein of unknown function (DUF3810)
LTVKRKLEIFVKYKVKKASLLAGSLMGLAAFSFVLSLFPLISPAVVEARFSRTVFPIISSFMRFWADSVPFAWLDLLLLAVIPFVAWCVWRRRWKWIGVTAAVGYLVFFWSWGVNYHREPLSAKLALNPNATSRAAMDEFAHRAARELNALYAQLPANSFDESTMRQESANRVARVVEVLDGTKWTAPSRVKVSILGNAWFRVAGIDGVFNPIVHEPVINSHLLDVERPFIISHELAHVRGYPDEGDANFVAILATVLSEHPQHRYSGWLHLWLYVRNRELDALLDPGPRQDVQRIFDRLRREQIQWISNVQSAVLDLFLKANSVEEGVRSYSRVVLLAAGTQDTWDRFR